jgi:DNA-binding response OmpR family regulator
MQVALVEDDDLIAHTLEVQLAAHGIAVEVFATGAGAMARFARHDLDAAVVDMGLPDTDGADLIAAVRKAGMWAPILVLTGRAALDDRVRALRAGADDYVVKPVAGEEIVARLGALVRRASGPRWAPLAFGRIVLNAHDPDVLVDGRTVALSAREHGLLRLLLRRQGDVVTREEILTKVFGYARDPGTNLVNVHVAHLRSKLKRADVVIRTVRGRGFRLEARQMPSPEIGLRERRP